jgi:hypothetical protein
VSNDSDCDDDDDTVYPSARELCDGVDNDCNGTIDDGGTYTWYADADGDGFGDPTDTVEDCADPDGYVAAPDDCDDADPAINPDADEICNDIDDDCDGAIDGPDATDATAWYRDGDGDGYGDDDAVQLACEAPSGTVDQGGDCDDTEFESRPDADEVCNAIDDDCDGLVDDDDSDVDTSRGGTFYADDDGDGFGDPDVAIVACAQPSGAVTDDRDCNDLDAAINPAASEVCDGSDNDCDGLSDDDDPTVDTSTGSTYYTDDDSDGYAGSGTVEACVQPAGADTVVTDCDDSDAAVNPAASEVCNSIDDDCDGLIDDDDSSVDASTGTTYYTDADSDGFGGSGAVQACTQPSGTTATSTDCDDSTAAVNPAASEVCNSIDDDCDGLTDDADGSLDASTGSTFYTDSDGDGFGGASAVQACVQPSGAVSSSTDCDDSAAAVNPAASEVCNSIDDDCDGLIDDDDSSVDASTGTTYYRDADSDSYGDAGNTTQTCSLPSGYARNGSDCNDSDGAINPGEAEICNNVDDDCDGLTDDDDGDLDASTATTWYPDDDEDGYGDSAGSALTACDEPSGYVDDDTDCDDADTDVNPAATEVCNGYDDDCDAVADSSSVCPCDVEYDVSTEEPYLFCTSADSWLNGRATCRTYGYDLVTINSASEDSWLNSTADSYSTQKWWTGFNDRASEGTWVWSSGQSVSYTNWEPGEPNDAGFREDCGQLNRFSGDTWNDEPCGSSFRYICEAN